MGWWHAFYATTQQTKCTITASREILGVTYPSPADVFTLLRDLDCPVKSLIPASFILRLTHRWTDAACSLVELDSRVEWICTMLPAMKVSPYHQLRSKIWGHNSLVWAHRAATSSAFYTKWTYCGRRDSDGGSRTQQVRCHSRPVCYWCNLVLHIP